MVGSGGGISQADLNRDTHKFAFKASAIKFRGDTEWTGIAKDPVTDSGKRSKKGYLHLFKTTGGYQTVAGYTGLEQGGDVLRPVYRAGEALNQESIDTIRARIDAQLFSG